MKWHYVALILVCLMPTTALALPLVYHSSISLNERVNCACWFDDNLILVSKRQVFLLANDSLLNLSTLPVNAVACDAAPSARTLYLVSREGTLYSLDLSTGKLTEIIQVADREEEPYKLAVSSDGTLAIVAIRYKYKNKFTADKLVIVNITKKSIIKVRDVASTPRLARLFSFERMGDFLVVQTIDTFCETCVFTDNAIEVYDLRTGRIIHRNVVGLALVTVDEANSRIVAVRLSRESDGTYRTLVINLNTGGLKLGGRVNSLPRSIAAKNGLLALVADRYKLVSLTYGSGAKLGALDLFGVTGVCWLELRGDEYLVAVGRRNITVLTRELKSIWTQKPTRYSPSESPRLVCRGSRAVVIYNGEGNARTAINVLRLYDRIRLVVRILNPQGSPVPNATVTVRVRAREYALKTDREGIAIIDVAPGRIALKVSAEGYEDKTVEVDAVEPVVLLDVVLGKTQSARLTVKVEWHSKPLAGVRVTVFSEGKKIAEELTDERGIASFENMPMFKELRIVIWKKGFESVERRIVLRKLSQEVDFQVSRKDLSVKVIINDNSEKCLVKLLSEGEKINITKRPEGSLVVFKGLREGYYEIKVICPCGTNSSELEVASNVTLRINTVKCPATERGADEVLDEIIPKLENVVVYAGRTSKRVHSARLTALSGESVYLDFVNASKVYVLEFFHTRCSGCEALLPVLKDIKRAYPETVEVILVSVGLGESLEDLEEYIDKHSLRSFAVYMDYGGELSKSLDVTAVPTIVVIYRGEIVFMGVGATLGLVSGEHVMGASVAIAIIIVSFIICRIANKFAENY